MASTFFPCIFHSLKFGKIIAHINSISSPNLPIPFPHMGQSDMAQPFPYHSHTFSLVRDPRYKYNVIISFLRSKHDIFMNVRTLKRKLVKYKLSRNETWRSKEEVNNIIKEEMQRSGCLSGYRKMLHLLKIKYNMHVLRNMVAHILHDIDPEASSLRKKKKLK